MKKLMSIENATFGYKTESGFSNIVSNINFSMQTGDFILLEGNNGCGKTTILKGLFGLTLKTSGKISWNISTEQIAYVPQELSLNTDIPATPLDYVCTACPLKWTKKETKEKAIAALKRMDLQDMIYEKFSSLSGGQKRRVLIARAIASDPLFLILDEPMVNIDDRTAKKIESFLDHQVSSGEMGILATTHKKNWAKNAKRIIIERHIDDDLRTGDDIRTNDNEESK